MSVISPFFHNMECGLPMGHTFQELISSTSCSFCFLLKSGYLVSRFNRDNIIGRPIVYFVKDAFSRIVTGLYVGLEGPSWIGMAMTLYNAFTDKVDFCHRYGIEITEDQWPCHHLPFENK